MGMIWIGYYWSDSSALGFAMYLVSVEELCCK